MSRLNCQPACDGPGHHGLSLRQSSLRPLLVLLGAVLALEARTAQSDEESWRYLVPENEPLFDRPVFQAVRWSAERPEDVRETVEYRGRERLYAQLRFGGPDSRRVVVVLDVAEGGVWDLYVDANRDRRIEEAERVRGTEGVRYVVLEPEAGGHRLPARVVALGRGATANTLRVATAGVLEGEVNVAGRVHRARRVDGDANGLFSDPRDRIWIDLNDDGKWDPFTEQFPLMPVLRLGEQRYAVRSSPAGDDLELTPIIGVGTLRLRIGSLPAGARLRELSAMLVGEDGSAFGLRSDNDAVSVPVGRYAIGSISLSLLGSANETPWNFVFSQTAGPTTGRWHTVEPDSELVVDPIGELRFVLDADLDAGVHPGQFLIVQPRLYSAGGLLINSCTLGTDRQDYGLHDRCASVRLVTTDSNVLATAQSGFA